MDSRHPVLKRFFYTQWHKFTSRRFSVRLLLLKLIIFGAWFSAFIVPPLVSGKIGPKLAIVGGFAFIAYGILQNYPGIRDFQRKNFKKNKIKRKTLTADTLDRMLDHKLSEVPLTPELGTPLVEEVLEIIANHVRAIRYDRAEEKIFSSLLVEHDSKHLQVIARSKSEERRDRPTYKKSDMLVWTSMTQRRAMASGDIFVDFPNTSAGKAYKSVLVIPIFYNDEVIAALSIDSSEPYHFTGKEEEINTRLLSYTVLLKKILLKYNIVRCSFAPQTGRE